MHNPEGPTSADFIDWEAVRKTEEYRKHILRFLKAALEHALRSPDYNERLARAVEGEKDNLDDFESLEDFMEKAEEKDFRTEEEQEREAEIFGLESVDDVKQYVRENDIDFDVEAEIKKIEGTYLEGQRDLQDFNDKHRNLVSQAMRLLTGEKPKDPDVQ